ncbi:hypothetical protein PPYR_07852 [Photinus pyralis]|uniref:Uncharacterized protein n=1 Tax=Photinus pyralis TaxID=7054 RepID=A0A5N4ARN4_PHOPY|nr:hypothetical protein PPYR_07849 [Photinus pyralis]KAB0799972.1 hypothetical protein PPYR_07852 [Photinus pyralis]
MAEVVIRLVMPARQKLHHATKKLMESDIVKELLEKWNELTSFINFDDNMLDAVNSKHYELFFCNNRSSMHLPSVDIPSDTINVLDFLEVASLSFKISEMQNLMGHQVHQSSKLYRKMWNPLALFGDKVKPYHPCIPGVQSYMTYNLLCNSLVNNFYVEKQHQELKQLLKCRYVLYSLDNRKHMTTTYVNSTEMRNLTREIVRELLATQTKILKSNFGAGRRYLHCDVLCAQPNDINDRKGLMEINQKVFEKVEKELKCVKLLDKIGPSSSEHLNDQTTNQKSIESSKYVPLMLMHTPHLH